MVLVSKYVAIESVKALPIYILKFLDWAWCCPDRMVNITDMGPEVITNVHVKNIFVNKDFEVCPLIDWRGSDSPSQSLVRKSVFDNMDIDIDFT